MRLLTDPIKLEVNREELTKIEKRIRLERINFNGEEQTYDFGDIILRGFLVKYKYDWDKEDPDHFVVSLYFKRLWE